MRAEIVKADPSLRVAYGWALLSEVDGKLYYDAQGDSPDAESMERAVVRFVYDKATGGVMHKRAGDGTPVRVGRIVESVVVTDEKLAAMGLPVPASQGPRGWWIGIKYDTTPEGENVWKRIQRGELRGFSIAGRGYRKEIA